MCVRVCVIVCVYVHAEYRDVDCANKTMCTCVCMQVIV